MFVFLPIEKETKETIVNSAVQLINWDCNPWSKYFVNLVFLTLDTDITPIIPALEKVLDNSISQSMEDFNFKTITDNFSMLMCEYPLRTPDQFALIVRSLIIQEWSALSLNPN
jgi:predicted unusual protein kinase regulating ubiquinone biosynthesis (AarF/ABC1/UbiB family)